MQVETVYFDSASTTKPSDGAVRAAMSALELYGNPSSPHFVGMEAKRVLDTSRESLSKICRCTPGEIYFTASGTEANNTAIFGAAKLKERYSKVVVTTDSEHPSVAEPLKELEKNGYTVIRLSTKNGEINEAELNEALAQKVALVTVMRVNNETGAVYDIGRIRRAIDISRCGALLHSDCVQAFMKTPHLSVCDMYSVSAHKINGIKGAGMLYVKNGIKLPPRILGGGQEKNLRSGTENISAIAAFAQAASEWNADKERISKITALKEYLCKALKRRLGDDVAFNNPTSGVCTLQSITLNGLKSEVALNYLSGHGVCVSASSACSAKKKDNRILAAYGLTGSQIESTLRIGLSYTNTFDEADILAEMLENAVKTLTVS